VRRQILTVRFDNRVYTVTKVYRLRICVLFGGHAYQV